MHRIPFYNIELNNVNTEEGLQRINETFQTKEAFLVFFVNAHCFNLAQSDPDYMEALKAAHFVLNDGVGLKLASKLSGIVLKENMNGTDFIPKIIEFGYQNNKCFFLLGGQPGITDKASEKLQSKFPGIKINGTRNGYFKPVDEKSVVEQINASKADILIVGMGVPRQEKWLYSHKDEFTTVRTAVAGGAILDFMAEKVIRAPKLVQKIGLEWFWRFLQEPKRLFKRYFVGNFVFFRYIFKLKKKQ